MKDMLEKMELLNAVIKIRGKDGIGRNPGMLDYTRAMIHESVELEREYDWKWWKSKGNVDVAKAKEELIDILHFWYCCALKLGMDSTEIRNVFEAKYLINLRRQRIYNEAHAKVFVGVDKGIRVYKRNNMTYNYIHSAKCILETGRYVIDRNVMTVTDFLLSKVKHGEDVCQVIKCIAAINLNTKIK